MLLSEITAHLIRRAESRLGVELNYAHKIAQTKFSLLTRYNRIFGFLDPNRNTSALAYHVARLRGAIASDCGTCVQAEINLANQAGIDSVTIDSVLQANYQSLSNEITAVARLTDAVIGRREDDAEAREIITKAFGDAGLIEISFAMNGAALLPGIKRAMGYATACDIEILRKQMGRSQ